MAVAEPGLCPFWVCAPDEPRAVCFSHRGWPVRLDRRELLRLLGGDASALSERPAGEELVKMRQSLAVFAAVVPGRGPLTVDELVLTEDLWGRLVLSFGAGCRVEVALNARVVRQIAGGLGVHGLNLDRSNCDALAKALAAGMAGQADSANQVCSICLDAVAVGETNSIVLACGHAFHVGGEGDEGCSGLMAWIESTDAEGLNRTCPNCRRAF